MKVLWYFNIQVDKFIKARQPDIILVRKKKKECGIIVIAVPGDIRTKMHENEKTEKYEDLRRKISKLWGVQTTVIPIIFGALGTITDHLTTFLAMVRVSLSFETIQKPALLGSAHILRKVRDLQNSRVIQPEQTGIRTDWNQNRLEPENWNQNRLEPE